MTTKDFMDRLAGFIRELTEFYGELSQELPNLRVVVDNTRVFSEPKKIPPERSYSFRRFYRRTKTKKIVRA